MNGQRVTGSKRLYHGDIITFGKCKRFCFNCLGPDEFKFVCTQDGFAEEPLPATAERPNLKDTLEPKLNLLND